MSVTGDGNMGAMVPKPQSPAPLTKNRAGPRAAQMAGEQALHVQHWVWTISPSNEFKKIRYCHLSITSLTQTLKKNLELAK